MILCILKNTTFFCIQFFSLLLLTLCIIRVFRPSHFKAFLGLAATRSAACLSSSSIFSSFLKDPSPLILVLRLWILENVLYFRCEKLFLKSIEKRVKKCKNCCKCTYLSNHVELLSRKVQFVVQYFVLGTD